MLLKQKTMTIAILAMVIASNNLFSQISKEAQEFNSYLSKGDWLNFKKDYKNSNVNYLKAAKIALLEPYYTLNISKNYIHLKDEKSSLKYINTSIENGLTFEEVEEEMTSDSITKKFFTKKHDIIKAAYSTLRHKFLTTINVDLLVEIEKLKTTDQYFRHKIYKLPKGDTIGELYRKKALSYSDSLNEKHIKKLFEKHGANLFKEIGIANANKVKIVLWHSFSEFGRKRDSVSIQFYLDKIIQAINNYYIPSYYYSSLFDRAFPLLSPNQNYPSYYGTGKEMDNFGNTVFIKIFKIEDIDSRRQKLGLNSLYENAQMNKVVLPQDYKLPTIQ